VIRSIAFEIAYWVLSVFYALVSAFAAMAPGRGPLSATLRFYTRRMLWAMHWIAGIKVDVAGKERLPQGAFIVAAKHHSWGDGFVLFAHVANLSLVAAASCTSSAPSWSTTAAARKRARRWPRRRRPPTPTAGAS
jgi:1-acyl-sn-glycerol-3-phosphate acyltransferase